MTDEQMNHMVRRFLQWKLPKDFRPDGGIHFDADAAKKRNPNNHTYEPVGTNLFTADHAMEMIRFMVDGLPKDEDDDDYIAWMRWAGPTTRRYLAICDSDAERAFKVYRKRGTQAKGGA